MTRLVAATVLMLALTNCPMAQEEKNKHLVLPNPRLLRCKSADCFQLWPDNPTQANLVFPKRVMVDMNQNCLYGVEALYDKSGSLEDVKAAIDEAYGKWVLNQSEKSLVKLWRVEPDRFAIQLSVADKKGEEMNRADEGTRQVIYIAFGGRSACSTP